MLDLKYLRENLDRAKDLLLKRNVVFDLEAILALDARRSSLSQKIQILREERNKVSKEDNDQNRNPDVSVGIPTRRRRERGAEIKAELKILEPEYNAVNAELTDFLWKLPNNLHPDAPIGKTESENVVLRQRGEIPKFAFQPLDHMVLGKKLEILDFEKATKVAGSNFYFCKNELVILEIALMHFAIDLLKQENFTLFLTPDLAKLTILEGAGYQPKGNETQIYTIAGTDLGLIATSEITLGGYLSGEIINEKDLPLKYAGYSHCFRSEAGSYGKESRGLYRVHQFSKVEMFIYCLPQDSEEMHNYLLELEEKIYQKLEIPYRIIDTVSGELGAPAYRKYDLEAWMPGLNKWGEITSTSNCTDYQAYRLKIKYRRKDGSTDYLHTLNGTAIASSRVPIAILENFQQKDGSVIIPKVLQKYTGFSEIKPHAL